MKTLPNSKTARSLALILPLALLVGMAVWTTASPERTLPPNVDSATIAAHKATVLVFLSTQCPVSKVYTPRLNALAVAYRTRGVLLVGVYSNMQESSSEVTAFAKDNQITFPVVHDADAALATRYGATMTPQAFVVTSLGKVVYEGRVDDNVDTSLVKRHDLATALNSILAGRPVAMARTAAFGCIIRRPAAQTASTQITYSKDVAPILQQNCDTCHRTGQIGPMTLTSYSQAAAWRADIKRVTQTHIMPPWKADPGSGDFQDARRLSDAQVATLAHWADAGAPEGNLKSEAPMPAFPSGWSLGQPDMVLEADRPYHVAPDGPDVYRCFSIPAISDRDRYVSAVDVQPGNRAVVHHVIAFLDGKGISAGLDGHETEPGYTSFGGVGFLPTGALGGWAPGMTGHFLPPGVAIRVAAGSRVVLQVHYHKDGKLETDHTRIGIYFAKGSIDKTIHIDPLIHGLQIPPGDAHYTVTQTTAPSPVDIHLVAITPHMHLLGRSVKVTALMPDGTTKPLISISNWDFNWQATYYYKQPVALPRGSRITMTVTYDNSANNPRNPNSPPKLVTWGEQTTDEMCITFLHYTLDREHDAIAPSQTASEPNPALSPPLLSLPSLKGKGKS